MKIRMAIFSCLLTLAVPALAQSPAPAARPARPVSAPSPATAPAASQAPAAQTPASAPVAATSPQVSAADRARMETDIIEVKNQNPDRIADVVRLMLSPGGTMQAHRELQRISIRDFPENVAKIKAAIERLDVDNRSALGTTRDNHEVLLYLIATSRTSTEKSELPAGLEPVINQLQETLRYKGYRYITTFQNRIIESEMVNSNGVSDSMFPIGKNDGKSFYTYSYTMVPITDGPGKKAIRLNNFYFGVKVPTATTVGPGQSSIHYHDVGIKTSVQLREGEKVVVGTANLGSSDEAIIVVVAARRMN